MEVIYIYICIYIIPYFPAGLAFTCAAGIFALAAFDFVLQNWGRWGHRN